MLEQLPHSPSGMKIAWSFVLLLYQWQFCSYVCRFVIHYIYVVPMQIEVGTFTLSLSLFFWQTKWEHKYCFDMPLHLEARFSNWLRSSIIQGVKAENWNWSCLGNSNVEFFVIADLFDICLIHHGGLLY